MEGRLDGPLEGIRILDMTVGQQGPYATVMLSDMGAEVIKVEDPRYGGDSMRVARPEMVLQGFQYESGVNAYFETNNRNKQSITVNAQEDEGREILLRLAGMCDVFVHNRRPGVMGRLGLGYESLKEISPAIIYASASAYGSKGPDAGMRGIDQLAQARGGIMSVTGGPEDAPSWIPGGIADQVGGFLLAHGIVLALLARERTGVGQEVNTSLLGGQIALQSWLLQGSLFTGKLPPKLGRQERVPLFNTYQARDGKWLTLAIMGRAFWPRLCRALDAPELVDDARFASPDKRLENKGELISLLSGIFATKDRDTWMQLLMKADVMAAPVKDYVEVAEDPQATENGYITDFNHPVLGATKVLGTPIQLGDTPGRARTAAPRLGEHTEGVLTGLLGYSAGEVEGFRTRGAI
ncbi:MAG: CoA transferase [Dehalococcoidia bacterium]|nr:CoA transferase [Dehalococcoidia bacterium]